LSRFPFAAVHPACAWHFAWRSTLQPAPPAKACLALCLGRDHRQPEGLRLQRPFNDQGMPDFTGKLKDEDVVKIQAFIQGTADAIRPKKD
jgi:hypothetical protein